MFKAIQTSVSGLLASTARANTAASNIVNSQVASTPFSTKTSGAYSPGFTPQRTQQTSSPYGGVRTTNVPVSPASLSVYNPTSPQANELGLVDLPNVSFPAEIAELQRAKHAYTANARVLKTLEETAGLILKS